MPTLNQTGGDCCEAREPQRIVSNDERLEACRPGTPVTGIEKNPKIKQIQIEQLDLGYIVRVGCQSFAIETSDKLVSALGEYLKDPSGVEKQWFCGAFLK